MWANWMAAALGLRPAFSRLRTFCLFVTTLAAMSVRRDRVGVTDFIRGMKMNPSAYGRFLHFFQSKAVDLPKLTRLWAALSLKLFAPSLFLLRGRIVLVGDGIKVGKEGKRMPAVKKLHQSSQSNSKAEWIAGHSFQALALLVRSGKGAVAVPLVSRIHEGLRTGPRDRRTLMDKFFDLVLSLGIDTAKKRAYLVADAYYCCGPLARRLQDAGVDLITRARKNAVAYFPPGKYPGKGRPAKYGKKIKLWDLFPGLTKTMEVSAYSGKKETVKYGVFDLLWKSYGGTVRFCLVDHPTRGRIVLMSLDRDLTAEEIYEAYVKRFKIEYSFKESVHVLGAFSYRFWLKGMGKTKRNDKDKYLHKKTPAEREGINGKVFSYHLYVQTALIAQGLMQYLAARYPESVWDSFGGWLRTIRPGIPPSAQVVREALGGGPEEFRASLPGDPAWQKFAKTIWERPPPAEEKAA